MIRRIRKAEVWLSVILIAVSACRQSPKAEHADAEIIVAAAANLTDAFQELAQQFTTRTGTKVVLSFGGTADLAKQIENGAPFDVFAAADVAHVDALDQKGLLTPGSRAVYARGSLVLWIPSGSMIKIEGVPDLSRKEIERIAIAKPDIAPYGQAAVETLRSANLWESIQPKVVYGMNVSQVKQFVSSGNAEVGFLPRSLVKAGEGTSIAIEDGMHQPLDQALAVVRSSSRQGAARRFTEFVLSAEGQALLEKYGYKKSPLH